MSYVCSGYMKLKCVKLFEYNYIKIEIFAYDWNDSRFPEM